MGDDMTSYEESSMPRWIWPVVALACVFMLCGTTLVGGYFLLQKLDSNSSIVTPSVPIVQLSASRELSQLDNIPALTAPTQQVLAQYPGQANTVQSLVHGLAVGVSRLDNTVTTPQQVRDAVTYAGKINFDGNPVGAQIGTALDPIFLQAIGENPQALNDPRRAQIVANFRAIAWGAAQVAGE